MTEPAPLLRVVRGEPSPEELAALLGVVAARAASGGITPARAARVWSAPSRLVRETVSPGRGSWRASARPR